MSELQPTSFAQLQEYAKGVLVELPPFAEGQPFFARLKRPSILMLAKSGKIPNRLLTAANKHFVENREGRRHPETQENEDTKTIDTATMFEAVAEASFVEPTWAQIKESGMDLTAEQYNFVFNYAQDGVKEWESFREEQPSVQPGVSGERIPQAAE